MNKTCFLMLTMAVSLLSSCTKDTIREKENDIIAETAVEYNVKMCDIQKYAEDHNYRYYRRMIYGFYN